MKKEYQVYYDGAYLDTIFKDNPEEARMVIASKLSVTQINIRTLEEK